MEKKDNFKKIKGMLKKGGPKATAEKDASNNPEAFMKKMKNPNIKNLKGIAF
jgi:hypothetical protein